MRNALNITRRVGGIPQRIAAGHAVLWLVTLAVVAAAMCPAVAVAQGDKANTDVRTLYLIRHGHYNYEEDADPDVGKALIPIGIAQARLVAARLKSIPVTMTGLYSSTMTRARQTAQVINEDFPELEHQKARILRECTPTTWREDIMAELEPNEAEECEEQLEKAWAEFFVPSTDGERHDIVVCHGNVIRYFVTKVLGVDTDSWLRMSIGNCSVTIVRIKPDGSFKLLGYADVGHIPPNLQTGLYYDTKNLIVPSE
jgi:serine/threonine-protein phosphatase PGAM5